jgi:hypothetical protein
MSDDPAMIDRRRAATALTARDFAWPEFDRWQATFAAVETFPASWEGLHSIPAVDTRAATAYRLRKLIMHGEWLDLLARRPAVLAHYVRRRLRARVVRQDERTPCPGCDPLNAREIGLELDALPPFHPGCRCVLVAIRPGRDQGRGRAHAPPRPRNG